MAKSACRAGLFTGARQRILLSRYFYKHKNAKKSNNSAYFLKITISIQTLSPSKDKLRERMGLFQLATNAKRSLVHTFITTCGVIDGRHKSIAHSEVTMDDLFES